MSTQPFDKHKPIGRSSYGSIAHLPGSHMGIGDKRLNDGQTRLLTEKCRDKYDLVVVQEKLDGSCVSVARLEDEIVALGRAGYLAESSSYEQHRMFSTYVTVNKERFKALLKPGERVVGEWLAMAHGTKYKLKHEKFVPFDIMVDSKRLSWEETVNRLTPYFTMPHVYHSGEPLSISRAKDFMQTSYHGAEQVEGVIYRMYRKGEFDFAAKYVRDDYVTGKYFEKETWNE